MITNMTMDYVKITPEKAQKLLDTTQNNRRLSEGVVKAYANDIIAGNWQEKISTPIAIDTKGVLRDGQHRLAAIVRAGIPIKMWVCRNVDPNGIYDIGRPRSISDQMRISCTDLEKVYLSTQTQSIIRFFIYKGNRRKITFSEMRDFIYNNHKILNPFFEGISQASYAKTGLAIVKIGMFTAYCAGVSMNDLNHFYTVLGTGMSEGSRDFPIIAYRNYLVSQTGSLAATNDEVKRCQFAIYKYITNSKTKRTKIPEEPLYPLYPEILYYNKEEG